MYVSKNEPKSRLCAYVKASINAKVKLAEDLELIKIETVNLQVFGLYRPFKINQNLNHSTYLDNMIDWISNNLSAEKEIIIIGDVNLDYTHRNNDSYGQQMLLQKCLNLTDSLNLNQIINEKTWSRVINGIEKSSILEHIYTSTDNHQGEINDINVSDHLLVSIQVKNGSNPKPRPVKKIIRNWSKYTKHAYLNLLDLNETRFEPMTIDEHEDFLSLELANTLNKLAPERKTKLEPNECYYTPKIRALKARKQNMIKKARKMGDNNLLKNARNFDKTIRATIKAESKKKIRNLLNDNSPKSLWNAVNLAKGNHQHCLPNTIID